MHVKNMLSCATSEFTILIIFLSLQRFLSNSYNIEKKSLFSNYIKNSKKYHEKFAYMSEHIIPFIFKSVTITNKNRTRMYKTWHGIKTFFLVQKKIESLNNDDTSEGIREKQSRAHSGIAVYISNERYVAKI